MNYPLAFKTKAGKFFKKHPADVSSDGTPRYVPNDNAPSSTYSLRTCMKDYEPIYDKDLIK